MASMDLLLEPHGPAPDAYEPPMVADALTHLRESPSASNPLVNQIPAARAILGLGLYIARGTRTDTLLPALALSQYIVTNLTTYVWGALLRWARYLVQTRDLHLVFRPPPPPAPNFSACSDSSLINAPITAVSMPDYAGSSYGGFALYFEGSGAFSVECFSPRRLADSSAGAELIMATWAGKSVVAFQMLQKELGMPRLLPTPLQIDASAVTDGVKMERVSRQQRFQAARLGMLRQWQLDRVLKLLKTDTEDMRADILTKPVNPLAKFAPKQMLLLTGSVSSSPSSRSSRPLGEPRGGAEEEEETADDLNEA
jgi:hypothetical protein